MKDIGTQIRTVSSLVPVLKTADTDCTGVDLQGYESAEVVFFIGARGDTWDASNHIQLEIEESSDNSTYTDVADASLTDTVTGTNTGTVAKLDAAGDGSQIYRTSYIGGSRYIRPVLNFTGTHSTGTVIGALVILGNARSAPTANP